MKFWTIFRPATGLMAGLVLFLALGAKAQTTNGLSDSEIEGRKLAQRFLEQRPATNSTLTGTLKIRDENGIRSEIPMKFEIIVTPTNWTSVYQKTLLTNKVAFEKLVVVHDGSGSNQYEMTLVSTNHLPHILKRSEVVDKLHFAGDFWAMDLGLEFFHWPAQKVLKKEFRRNCACQVLESTNPNPNAFPNLPDYSRVVSWIDEDSGGIVQAEAYDARGQLLKEFAPKSFKKVNGQWELQEMEIRNVQTGSRTRLEFDLPK